MAKVKFVVGQSSISAGQMKDFWRKVEDGTIGSENFGNFLENPHKFTSLSVTIVRALNILGAGKVVTAEQSGKTWGYEAPANAPIRYSEEVLRQCAQSNKEAGTDFRLVYLTGLSLRELLQKIGTDKKSQPCVFHSDWWLRSEQDGWANEKPEAGYYLIDFNGRFAKTSWYNQEKEIAKFENYYRAHEAKVAEAIVMIFKVTGERPLEGWYHWGHSLTAEGYRVCVGVFDADGVDITAHAPPHDNNPYMRVCLLRKFTS